MPLLCAAEVPAQEGADGVLVLGCHPSDCHYKEQNFRMIQRHRLFLMLLRQYGID
jgi:F420-non-reducing hydrogenase iron-sulfur subunit